ncbi:hypothetical protein GOV11_03480 [Candidatus Woesearchaeota archaeon]|nr:hypothetical protein [Candidatus Woesearchaeota archaeon]
MRQYGKKGWYGESYRHYLSAKGISTRTRRYFNDAAKGPGKKLGLTQPKSLAMLRSKGFSDRDIIDNPETVAQFEKIAGDSPGTAVSFIEIVKESKRQLPESASVADKIAFSQGGTTIAPQVSPSETLPQEPQISPPGIGGGEGEFGFDPSSSPDFTEVPEIVIPVSPPPPGPDDPIGRLYSKRKGRRVRSFEFVGTDFVQFQDRKSGIRFLVNLKNDRFAKPDAYQRELDRLERISLRNIHKKYGKRVKEL